MSASAYTGHTTSTHSLCGPPLALEALCTELFSSRFQSLKLSLGH